MKQIWDPTTNSYKIDDPRANERGRMLLAESQRDDPITAEVRRQEQAARRAPKGDRPPKPDGLQIHLGDIRKNRTSAVMDNIDLMYNTLSDEALRKRRFRRAIKRKYREKESRDYQRELSGVFLQGFTNGQSDFLAAKKASQAVDDGSKLDIARRAKQRQKNLQRFKTENRFMGKVAFDAGRDAFEGARIGGVGGGLIGGGAGAVVGGTFGTPAGIVPGTLIGTPIGVAVGSTAGAGLGAVVGAGRSVVNSLLDTKLDIETFDADEHYNQVLSTQPNQYYSSDQKRHRDLERALREKIKFRGIGSPVNMNFRNVLFE